MVPPGLKTPDEVYHHYEALYERLIDSGEAIPFTYPGISIGAAIVLSYLLIDHRRSRWLTSLRYPVFACLCAFQLWCVVTNRARGMAAGFFIGLISAFGCAYVFMIMIANDCQAEFRRLERAEHTSFQQPTTLKDAKTSFNDKRIPAAGPAIERQRPKTASEATSFWDVPSIPNGPLYWQSYPSDSLIKRIDWISDLFFSFRGVGWNWQISGLPPPPKWVEAQLKHGTDTPIPEHPEPRTTSRTGIRRYSDRSALLKDALTSLAICYFGLDTVKALIRHDPHFWGYINHPAPPHLPAMIRASPFLLQAYRLATQCLGAHFALKQIFALGPLFMCGVLGSKWYGVRGEPWMNPANMFGDFSFVGERGLTGWWGGWWHQVFRSVFEAPATLVLRYLHIDKRSQRGKTLSLFIAFFVSGCLHAAGSYTQLGETRPLRGPMMFFLLQFVGIMVESAVKAQLHRTGVTKHVPGVVQHALNYLFAIFWMYHTAPLLVDDWARGGIWLYEPVPWSLWVALGFGHKGDTVWRWQGMVRWRTGKGWYDTGITF